MQHPTRVGIHVGKEAQERGRTEAKGSLEEGKSGGAKPQPRKGEWQMELPKGILEICKQAVLEATRQGKETVGLLWGKGHRMWSK